MAASHRTPVIGLAAGAIRRSQILSWLLLHGRAAGAADREGNAPTGCSGRTNAAAKHAFGCRRLVLLHIEAAEDDAQGVLQDGLSHIDFCSAAMASSVRDARV